MGKPPLVSEVMRELKLKLFILKIQRKTILAKQAFQQKKLKKSDAVATYNIEFTSRTDTASLLHYGSWKWTCLSTWSFTTHPVTKVPGSCFFYGPHSNFITQMVSNSFKQFQSKFSEMFHSHVELPIFPMGSSVFIRVQPYLRAVSSFFFI